MSNRLKARRSGRVRRFSPLWINPFAWYDPSDLSSMWLDTAGTSPVTTDGQSVARIDDKSGNGRHLTQATGSLCPLYKTSGGLHWLQFDGTDDRMAMAGNPTTVVAIAIAARVTSGLTGYRGIACTYNSGGGGSLLLARMTTNKWGTYGGSDQAANTSVLDDSDHVLMMDGTTSGTYYLDGVSDGTYAATSGQDPASVGGIDSQTTAMRLYGLVMRSVAFGADRPALNTYLGSKLGRLI